MSAERTELPSNPPEEQIPEKKRQLSEKKYPQSKDELRLELVRIWIKVKKNMVSARERIDAEHVLGITEEIEKKMQETLEAFDDGNKKTFRNNLNYLREVEKNIDSPPKKSEIKETPEMKLEVGERKRKFFETLGELKAKTIFDDIKSMLGQIGDDFEKAIRKGDIKEEENCWRALVSFKKDLKEIEKVVVGVDKLLEHSEDL